MARIGFYGGCFNPPTVAHIELAKKAQKECHLDNVIFVPVGDLYKKGGMAKGIDRYNMLQLACDTESTLKVSDIEINSNEDYKAIDIFEILKDAHKNDEVFFIMGVDNLKKMPLWKECEKLVKNFDYIILDRDDIDARRIIENNEFFSKNKQRFKIIVNKDFGDCSSTKIREQIKNGEKPGNLNNKVYDYIIKNNIY